MVQWMMVPLLFLPVHNIEEKDKFRLFVQYRGKCTEQYARALHNLQAPCKVIKTLCKLKTLLTASKPHVEWSMMCGSKKSTALFFLHESIVY